MKKIVIYQNEGGNPSSIRSLLEGLQQKILIKLTLNKAGL